MADTRDRAPATRPYGSGVAGHGLAGSQLAGAPQPADLADILERVLDKGIVIAGDIRVNLLDIELLTIRIRLLVASVDKAQEMGIDWWRRDPMLSSGNGSGPDRRREVEDG
ncbi:gas vesicle protein [Jiangella asiatica]|uniref:Gas vesicle protein n=1 Tax=Jiangella asiatica TaxID=2530372 RepID=A0A4R5CFX2_9ACTN|nr:gas vesicle protein [Jiangella asiatica]